MEYSIELLMLWLDVEHFRSFDGDQEDLTLMAQHLGEHLHTPLSVSTGLIARGIWKQSDSVGALVLFKICTSGGNSLHCKV